MERIELREPKLYSIISIIFSILLAAAFVIILIKTNDIKAWIITILYIIIAISFIRDTWASKTIVEGTSFIVMSASSEDNFSLEDIKQIKCGISSKGPRIRIYTDSKQYVYNSTREYNVDKLAGYLLEKIDSGELDSAVISEQNSSIEDDSLYWSQRSMLEKIRDRKFTSKSLQKGADKLNNQYK